MQIAEGFNYDVSYPSRGGTIFHRLQLELYGVGDDGGSPLGSWVLLAVKELPKKSKNPRAL
jgi:hypothetical protein